MTVAPSSRTHDVVQPDVVTEKNVQGAPDLVIEILSHGTKKRVPAADCDAIQSSFFPGLLIPVGDIFDDW